MIGKKIVYLSILKVIHWIYPTIQTLLEEVQEVGIAVGEVG